MIYNYALSPFVRIEEIKVAPNTLKHILPSAIVTSK